MTTYDRDKIKTCIPHRFENLVVDEIRLEEPGQRARLSTCIQDPDPLGRDLFIKFKTPDQKELLVPLSMEILALGSIVCSGQLKDDEMAIYAGISRFQKLKGIPALVPLTGTVDKLGERRGFYRYNGELLLNDTVLVTGNMTAFFTNRKTLEGANSVPEMGDPLSLPSPARHVDPFEFKHSDMTIIQTGYEMDATTFVGAYQYPENHPCVKGHFPGFPIMMGVMQWMGVEDTVFVFALAQDLKGHHQVTADVDILKVDGTVVSQMSGVVVDVWRGVDDIIDQSEVAATQKLTFKNRVNPGETIHTVLKNIQVTAV